jgi:18S rRNA (adenine1779-N6/adenine1780-N6)-dimethyltransferase
LGAFNICISNTPYQISSRLLFKLLSLANPPRTSILMVQREFALRLLARPGDALYSRLSVNVQFFARISHVMKVGKQNFVPPPKVESSVVRIEPKMPRPSISWEEWDGMLRICFLRKHKTLRALWTAPKVRAMVEHNWVMHIGLNGDDAIPEADLEFLRSEQGLAECADMGDEEELVDLPSEGEEDDLPSARLDLQSTLPAIVTLGAHRIPRSRISALVSLKVLRVLEETQLLSARAFACSENDFLRLLYASNQEGIRFS